MADELGVTIYPTDIDRSHRVGKTDTKDRAKKSRKVHRDIIVKFTSYNARRRLYEMRKELRDTENDNLKNVFLNEDLTKRRSEILYEARNLRHANKLKAAYSSDGKIIVRDKKDNNFQISDLNELVRFGYVMKPVAPDGAVLAPGEQQPSTSGASAMD